MTEALSSIPKAAHPFRRIHSDTTEPYSRVTDGSSRYYIVSAIDSYSGFVAIRTTLNTPIASDASDLLSLLAENFRIAPLILPSV